jgi:hypothetical protein
MKWSKDWKTLELNPARSGGDVMRWEAQPSAFRRMPVVSGRSQANVIVYASGNPVVNAIGRLWMRIVAVLT